MADVVEDRCPRAVLVDHDCLLSDEAAEAVARLHRAQVSLAVLCDGGADPRVVALGRQVICCPHDAGEGCLCRRPAPGLLLLGAAMLGVRAEECTVIGSSARDAEAAAAVGSRHLAVLPGRSLQAVVEDLLAVAEPDRAEPAVDSRPAGEPSRSQHYLTSRDVVPLVLMGARRLPASTPWSAGVIS